VQIAFLHVIAHVAFWTLKRGMAEVGLAG